MEKSSRTTGRLALSLAAAALAAAAVYPVFYLPVAILGDRWEFRRNLGVAGFFFLCALAVTAVHALFLGLPAVLLLRRAKALTFLNLAAAAVLAGAAPSAFLDPRLAPWTGFFGFVGAVAFWLVWSGGG
jgi:hypothetical protein